MPPLYTTPSNDGRAYVSRRQKCFLLGRPLSLISVEQVVVPNRQIEHMSWPDPGRVFIVIFRFRGGIVTRVEPKSAAGHELGKATRGVACTPLQERPAWNSCRSHSEFRSESKEEASSGLIRAPLMTETRRAVAAPLISLPALPPVRLRSQVWRCSRRCPGPRLLRHFQCRDIQSEQS